MNLNEEQLKIKEIIDKRGIDRLYHFTPIENLNSILQYGLLPRESIPDSAKCTDSYRWDGHLDTISLSITMLNLYLSNHKEAQGFHLCYLMLDPSILYKNVCGFYPHNAATACYRNIPFDYFTGADRFEELFAAEIKYQKSQCPPKIVFRSKNVHGSCPTSEQAEVLCKGRIPREYIIGILYRHPNLGGKLAIENGNNSIGDI